jgi:predicted phage terminase large subunit-like protein
MLLAAAKDGGEQWRVLSYRAIDDTDPRRPPEAKGALFPHRFERSDLESLKLSVGPFWWSALYEQSPTIEGGSVFQTRWWEYYEVLPRMEWIAVYADTAQKTSERHDYSVFQVWGKGRDNHIYLIDQIRGKWPADELKLKALAFWAKWKHSVPRGTPGARKLAVEDKSSGTGLIQQIEAQGGIPIEAIPRHIDKYVRSQDAAPMIAAGNVFIPSPETREPADGIVGYAPPPWLSDFMEEWRQFSADNSHAHDDQVDPGMDAIADMLGVGLGSPYSEEAIG